MKTRSAVIAEVIFEWATTAGLAQLGIAKRLEDEIGMWEWGKWCLRGEIKANIPSQIKFRGSRPESTAWDALVDMADDDAMRVDAAMRGLPPQAKEIMRRIYEFWQTEHAAAESMRISLRALNDIQLAALNEIHNKMFDMGEIHVIKAQTRLTA